MTYKASGKIEKIFDTEQKSAKFQTRDFVIEVSDGQYPQMVKFQIVQDKVSLVDAFKEGDMVDVDFDLRGREWNGKYFTNLQAWRVTKAGEGEGQNEAPPEYGAPSSSAPSSGNQDFDDDVPF